MHLVRIEQVKKGDFIRLLTQSKKPVTYVFDGYNRSTRKYEYHRFDDINAIREAKKGTVVNIGFDF